MFGMEGSPADSSADQGHAARLAGLGLGLEHLERLKAALGSPSTEEEFARRLLQIGDAALKEYVEWMLAIRRFSSSSQLDAARVLEIFAHVRVEPPTVESLATELAIPESRAMALLSRMRYGDARMLRSLAFRAAAVKIGQWVDMSRPPGESQTAWLDRDSMNCVRESAAEIMLVPGATAPGGLYPRAELPRYVQDRYGGSAEARTEMWQYILSRLEP